MKLYYYVDSNRNQQGPVTYEQLRGCGITPNTLVWTEGMANWLLAGNLPELSGLFSAPPPPPPRMVKPKNNSAKQKEEDLKTINSNNEVSKALWIIGAVLLLLATGIFLYNCFSEETPPPRKIQKSSKPIKKKSVKKTEDILTVSMDSLTEADMKLEKQKKVKKFLDDIYYGSAEIFEDQWVYTHCTKRMQKFLRDEYEYEGEGWGSWIIGGWEAGGDQMTKLSSITCDDNYYYVTIVPDGYTKDYASGKRIIRFVINLVNNVPVIDECKWIRDFKYNDNTEAAAEAAEVAEEAVVEVAAEAVEAAKEAIGE